MKTNNLLIALFGLLIAFPACKHNREDETTPKIPKIKDITTYLDQKAVGINFFEYDQAGRLLKNEQSNGNMTTYQYSDNQIIVNTITFTGMIADSDTLLLDDKGLAFKEKNGNQTFEYDPQGFLVKKTVQSLELHTYTYLIANGNTVQGSYRLDNHSADQIMLQNEFQPGSINTIGNENKGITFYGKQDKELISSRVLFNEPATFSYEYDTQKRVTKRIIQNGYTEVYTYY